MKAILLAFDSLNRHMLPPYGGTFIHAPNFRRLAERTLTFDRSYVCSMPCMPARRELHTGRPNFLHRGWGPLEPFDDSMPHLLKKHGTYTHLVTDHYHYFEDGGATYHTQYNSWEFLRGQEGDPWKGQVADPTIPDCVIPHDGERWRQDWVNRSFMEREEDRPQSGTFHAGIDFLRRNHTQDNWLLQLETFDPHEPFFSPRKYKNLYAEHYRNYKGRHLDWPPYREVRETPEEVEHCRFEYASLVSMCDANLGKVLNVMDELDLWKDTMLIVWTDHGFLLGEHDAWAKVWLPWYQELAHTPLFVWDPRCGKRGERRQSLVQTIDLAPTLLEFFGAQRPPDMLGKQLRDVIARDTPVREAGLFGVYGGHVNVTDGRHVYMRAPVHPDGQPLFEYTHMPTRMHGSMALEQLRKVEMAPPFSFTKGCPTMRTPGTFFMKSDRLFSDFLWDIEEDPRQEKPRKDPATEKRMIDLLVRLMRECDAPKEQYERLRLTS